MALFQANKVQSFLQDKHPHLKFRTEVIKTQGDQMQKTPGFTEKSKDGIYASAIEQALLRSEIDLAVHCLKDLPVDGTPGTVIPCITKRDDPHDVIITRSDYDPEVILTHSYRRIKQWLSQHSNCTYDPIRGNVDSRIQKLRDHPSARPGLIVTEAGLKRIPSDVSDLFVRRLSLQEMYPAPGQGCLAVQTRINDDDLAELLRPLHDAVAAAETTAERQFLKAMGGGCTFPLGAYGKHISHDQLRLSAVYFFENDPTPHYHEMTGSLIDPEGLANRLAQHFLELHV